MAKVEEVVVPATVEYSVTLSDVELDKLIALLGGQLDKAFGGDTDLNDLYTALSEVKPFGERKRYRVVTSAGASVVSYTLKEI